MKRSSCCCSTLIFVALISGALCGEEQTGSTIEGTANKQQSALSDPVPQCSVCWSTESAAHCQREATPKLCTDEQLNATVAKLQLLHPANGSADKGDAPRHYAPRCYTLSAVAGTGDARKAFYGKGCTTADPCAGWPKERGACALCSGSNCNVAAPVDQGRAGGAKAAIGGAMANTNHTSAGTPGIHCSRWAAVLLATGGALSWMGWAAGL